MKKLNSKGFTLVELLVAITILGIVLVIALPQVSNLQTENAKTKYKKYAESVVSSAKLYTDSYSKDMFGNNSSGCYDIPYSALSAKILVKDIKIDNSTCDTYAADKKTSLTFVRVYKSNENYLYDISIKCNDKNGKEIYNESLEKDICDGTRTDTEGPTISISVNSNWTTGKAASGNALNATVKIRDPYGLKENVQVEYAWTKTPSNISGLTFKTKKFTNSRTELVQELSFKVQYPQNENGEWYLVVRPAGTEGLRDANGNYYSGGYEKSAVVRLDNTKPTIDKTTNSHNGKWTADQVTISATASDTLSGVKKIYYTYKSDGSSLKSDWAKSFTAGSRGPVEVSKIWTQELNETIYVVAEDMVGNKSTIKSAGTVQIDNTPPKCTSSGGSATWTNGNRTIKGTCSDNGSGCKGDVSKTYSTNTNSTKESPGTVYDNVGNSVVCPANQTVKIDKTAPTCSSSGGNATWTNGNRTIKGTCGDTGGSGCKGNTSKTYSSNTNTTTASPGTVYDNAGNSATCPANQTVKIDKTAPTCSSSGGNATWTNGNRTITGTCSDTGGSGCKGNASKTYSSNTNTTTASPGTVYDNAGNSATCPANQTVKIDKTAPTCSSSGGNATWTNGNRTITGTCSDTGGSGCAGNASKTYSSNTNTTTASPGTVKDKAGNSATCPANQTVKIDKTAPTISSISNPSGGKATSSPFALTLSGSDTGGSGLAKWRYSYNNSSWTDYANSNKSPFTTTKFSAIRNQNVYISACDNAGNCSASSSTRIHIVNPCSTSNPTACPQYHTCRSGYTVVFDQSSGGFQGYINDSQTIYKIGEANGRWYVYVSGTIKGYYAWNQPTGFGYIYSNCIEPIGTTCPYAQCQG